jgi:hypothetical protein
MSIMSVNTNGLCFERQEVCCLSEYDAVKFGKIASTLSENLFLYFCDIKVQLISLSVITLLIPKTGGINSSEMLIPTLVP